MTITFTIEEMQWIEKKKFKWTIKDECPKKIKKIIQNKLNTLNEFHKEINSNG